MKWEDTAAIEAPADVVWRLTVDVANLPSVTPTMLTVERLDDGPLRVGSSARIKQPRQAPAVWTVTVLETGREFVWQTRRWGMTMVGAHRLEDHGDGCTNTLSIELTGPGSGLLGVLIGGAVRKAIGTENACFKATAESAKGGR